MSGTYRALSAFAAMALCACASEPAPVVRYSGDSSSLAQREAREIEAARRHPNAQPRVRPQYPEQAPPPLPAGTTLPPPMYLSRRSEPYPSYPASIEREVYVDPSYSDAPRYGFGLSYGYGYPYGGGYWGGYYPSRYRYGYGFGVSHGFGHSSRYHTGTFGGGYSLHVRSIGGGGHHHH